MNPSFAATVDPPGLRVVDPIEHTRFRFETPRPVSPEPTGTDAFYFPVDTAVTVRTPVLATPKLLDVYVRSSGDGSLVEAATDRSEVRLPRGDYNVEVVTNEVKLYLAAHSALVVERDTERVTVDFGDETTVTVGARSFHESPAHTVTTTDRVEDVMAAVSTFGSALKTTSPERSFPTLRGHPPLVESGGELSVPPEIDRPDTGVRIEVPARLDRVYPVASLAYYLGASVVPGGEPRLVTDSGFEHALDGPEGFEDGVARTLKQVFFLDCLVRTEGYYEVDLHERELAEPEVDLDFAALYDRPLAEQLEAYLREDYEDLAAYVPRWKQTADVWPSAEQAAALPFAANDLAVIRCPDLPGSAEPDPAPKAMVDFYRAARDGDGDWDEDLISVEETDSLEHVWYGDGYPVGATKTSPAVQRRRFDVEPREEFGIEVAIVCNDERMRPESESVDGVYGLGERTTCDVSVYDDLSRSGLADLLAEPKDFLHYVGHVERDGIECADGLLDAGALESVGTKAFVLNGCRSYRQAHALVERGALAGVGTLARVGNAVASETGQMLARLLNYGYPLQFALAIATTGKLAGNQYVVVGDGGVELVTKKDGTPSLVSVEATGEDGDVTVEYTLYATQTLGLGTFTDPYITDTGRHYMMPGTIDTFEVSKEQFERFADAFSFPVEVDGEIYWSDRFSVADL